MTDTIFTAEERYRLLVEGAKDYAMILLDPNGCIVSWNSGAERIMGWAEAEVMGLDADLIFTPEDCDSGIPRQELARARQEGRGLDLRWHVKKDGTRFFADGIMECLRDASGELRGYAKIMRDATDAELARLALRDSQEQYRDAQNRLEAALSAGGIATWTWNIADNRVVADPNLARLFSVSPEDAAGGQLESYIQAIHPDDRARVAEEIGEAVASQDHYSTEYRVALPGGVVRWLEARGKVVRAASGQATSLDGVVVDVTERLERRRRERFQAELADRVSQLAAPDAVIAETVRSLGEFMGLSRCIFSDIDLEADTVTIHPGYLADDSMESIAGVYPLSSFGPTIISEFLAGRATVVDDVRADSYQVPPENLATYEQLDIRAHISTFVLYSDRLVSAIGAHSSTVRHWTPEEVELVQAVVDRTWLMVAILRQQRALARESEERRIAHERTFNILESIGDAFFALDAEWRFTYVNDQMERIVLKSREELLGKTLWESFPGVIGTQFEHQYKRARRENIPTYFEEFYPPLEVWLDVRAYPSADGLSVFFQDVNERKQAEAERERLLAEQSARAEREALINRIGQALRRSPNPEAVLETSVRELGLALKADRCYYVSYNQDMDKAMLGPDWFSDGLQSIAGPYLMSPFVVNSLPGYRAGRTQVVSDTQALNDAAALKTGLRALVRVPLVSGTTMTALAVAMADEPREWTADEVALIETVATQTQTALEAALLSRREHAIAQQLQTALQPVLPQQVPGLSVGALAKAALDESEVGGDFMDLFPLDKELYAIVIGDVSGKGLAAAQQLALVRNSLRTTLYLTRSAAQAAGSLNSIVTAHELLIGFVTTFVGIYDAGDGAITYVSCGHEPALVRRAGGSVEALASSSGPPLGVDQNASYEENSVTLAPGDALLLYTDGLSEAGPDRRSLLGTTGLTQLLQSLPPDDSVQDCAEALVAQAAAYAGGSFRDDVAVILARRE